MKIVAINTLPIGSTGNIMYEICLKAKERGIEIYPFYGKWKNIKDKNKKCKYFGYVTENLLSACLSRITGLQNCFSVFGTIQLIRECKKINPDVIHIHNIHLNIINIPLLMSYIKKENIPIIWTLHDCWIFTGHCTHFSYVKCEKWKKKCFKCPLYKSYPNSIMDNSRYMFYKKKRWFSGIKNLTLITPSMWLAEMVKQSFLENYQLKVINNGIDLKIFRPYGKEIRKSLFFPEKKFLVLGVAYKWNKKKGIDVFIELSKILEDKFQIVLVGTDKEVDRKLPHNIISICKTESQEQLAKIYSSADVFVNPTREDTFPTVNIEALACGTPVITFNAGGSAEIIDDRCGKVVEIDDVEKLKQEIILTCESKVYSIQDCRKRAEKFNKNDKYQEYIKEYFSIIK